MAPRWIILGTALVAVVGLAACGDDDDSAEEGSAVSTSDLDGRTFTSSAVEGYTLVEGTSVTLDFADGRVAANAGCNTMTGGAEVDGGELKVDALAQTMMACEDALQSQDEWLAGFLTGEPNIDLAADVLTLTSDEATLTLSDA